MKGLNNSQTTIPVLFQFYKFSMIKEMPNKNVHQSLKNVMVIFFTSEVKKDMTLSTLNGCLWSKEVQATSQLLSMSSNMYSKQVSKLNQRKKLKDTELEITSLNPRLLFQFSQWNTPPHHSICRLLFSTRLLLRAVGKSWSEGRRRTLYISWKLIYINELLGPYKDILRLKYNEKKK